jgi:hypothetical protein
MAAINATVGVVILFAGALIGGDFILVFTAIIGVWMIGISTMLMAVAGFNSRVDSGRRTNREP